MKERSLNELHLFAGAGGGILGGILLGHTCVCAVEIEPYCRKVLLQRQRDGILPKFPIWDDVRTFDGKPWRGLVDVVCGGFPCQDISVAGKGAGIKGKRSGLWKEMARIIGEIRPRYAFVENSPMLLVRGIGDVLGDLAGMGYDSRYGIIGTNEVGGYCRGERIWILAEANSFRHQGRKTQWNQISKWSVYKNKPKNRNRIWCEASGCVSIGDWEKTASKICGMDYGVANRLDRLGAIGNGQVPAVVKLAWETLICAC